MIAVDRGGFGRYPAPAKTPGEQLLCLTGGQQVKGHRVGAIRGGQADQLIPAGHHDEGPG